MDGEWLVLLLQNEHMKKIIAGLLILFPIAAFSQTISGTVKDDQGKSLAGASVALKKVNDSSIVKLAGYR
jgi:hypothetical protein